MAGGRRLPEPPKERHLRTDDSTIIPFHQPGSIIDPLTEIARDGARHILMAALKPKAACFVSRFSADLLADGRQRVVRHRSGPDRVVKTGIGPIEVRRQKVRVDLHRFRSGQVFMFSGPMFERDG